METQTAIVLFALVAAFGLVSVVAVDIMLTTQEAEAKCIPGSTGFNCHKTALQIDGSEPKITEVKNPFKGCNNPLAVNASGGKCVH